MAQVGLLEHRSVAEVSLIEVSLLENCPDGTLNGVISRDEGVSRHEYLRCHLDGVIAELRVLLNGMSNDFEHFLEDSFILSDMDAEYSQHFLKVVEECLVNDRGLPNPSVRAQVSVILRPRSL